jgi:hypothetical protein
MQRRPSKNSASVVLHDAAKMQGRTQRLSARERTCWQLQRLRIA